jgi:hypothetical protein
MKRSNDTEGIIEPPKKRPNNVKNTHHKHTTEAEITNSDNDTLMSQDLPESVTQAPKCGIIIEMSNDIKLPTKYMNGTKVTRQAAFEDLNWEPRVLETEAEKQAEWEKNAEWMEVEAEPDQMTEAEKVEAKRQRQRELARERQRKH